MWSQVSMALLIPAIDTFSPRASNKSWRGIEFHSSLGPLKTGHLAAGWHTKHTFKTWCEPFQKENCCPWSPNSTYLGVRSVARAGSWSLGPAVEQRGRECQREQHRDGIQPTRAVLVFVHHVGGSGGRHRVWLSRLDWVCTNLGLSHLQHTTPSPGLQTHSHSSDVQLDMGVTVPLCSWGNSETKHIRALSHLQIHTV